MLLVSALAVLFGGVATARVIVSGEAEIAASTAALEAGKPLLAVVHARRAARWFAPGAPHVPVAYLRLTTLAEGAEKNGRDDIALASWRSIRAASLESRWLLTPHEHALRRANREIARLMVKVPASGLSDAAMAKQQLVRLSRYDNMAPLWIALLGSSFVAALFGLLLWSRQVAAAGGRLRPRLSHSGMWLTVGALALWLLAAWRS